MKPHLPYSRLFLIFCAVAGAFLLPSCGGVRQYYQVTTFESEDVKLQDSGSFVYETDEFSILYDLWSENGEMTFSIVNKTDSAIVLDLDKSYYVFNGLAHDYYQARMFGSSSSHSRMELNSSSSSLGVSRTYLPDNLYYYYDGFNRHYNVANTGNVSVSSSKTTGWSRTSTSYREYDERKLVVIPAKTYKVFSEFGISQVIYRECGMALDPKDREVFARKFGQTDTPIKLENRLCLIVNGKQRYVTNSFFACMVANMNENNYTDYEEVKDCNGRLQQYNKKVAKYGRADRMYVKYTSADVSSWGNDRTKESKKYNIKPKDDYRRPGTEKSKTNRQNNGNYDFLWY